MELDAVAFPALIVADDGWVEFAKTATPLSVWTTAAVSKYSRRRVLLYDRLERVWLADSIAPRAPRNVLLRLGDKIRNPRIAIRITVHQITDGPVEAVRDALLAALDADDDVLTHNSSGAELKQRIQNASSFNAVVDTLRSARAIDA